MPPYLVCSRRVTIIIVCYLQDYHLRVHFECVMSYSLSIIVAATKFRSQLIQIQLIFIFEVEWDSVAIV